MMIDTKSNQVTILIVLFILLCWGSLLYYYYSFVGEEIIPPTKIASLDGEGFDFTITARCKSEDLFSSTPYVSVKVENLEILSAAVNQGYDSTHQCVISSVAKVALSQDQKKLLVYMNNGKVKEINILAMEDEVVINQEIAR